MYFKKVKHSFEVLIASEKSNKRRNEAEDIIAQESERKRQKYVTLNHIPPSNALDRLVMQV